MLRKILPCLDLCYRTPISSSVKQKDVIKDGVNIFVVVLFLILYSITSGQS